jgi:hypothetical protein
MGIFQPDHVLKNFITITIAIENVIRINQTLFFIFPSNFD